MRRTLARLVMLAGAALAVVLLAPLVGASAHRQAQTSTHTLAQVTVFATGLKNPRGLTFGPDGNLYVAEGGAGGTNSTVGQCAQVVAPVGPYTGGFTARISKISPAGARSTVIDNLPSSQTGPALGNLVSGVADVQFSAGTLYGLESGAGCSHGLIGTDNTIFRVNSNGTTTTVADLSAFLKAHPVANPDVDDFEPDGTWYGMVAVRGAFYANEPNHQELDLITLDGRITRVLDMSTLFVPPPNWQGPTGIAYHGNFYFGTLGTFPVRPGTQNIYKVTPSGSIKVAASGLTAVLGVAFDVRGRLYALETDTVAGFPGPQAIGSGTVVCVNGNGTLNTVATGLTFPTGMTFGPDGKLYVSNIGFGAPPGAGQIVRINTSAKDCN
ncbi:MAG TPA: ScyD/ScyE family protein [Ktedonobacteraceae bacterium]